MANAAKAATTVSAPKTTRKPAAKKAPVAKPAKAAAKPAVKPQAALKAPKGVKAKQKAEAPKMEQVQVDAPKPTAAFQGEKGGVKPPVRPGNCMDVWLACSKLQAEGEAVPAVAAVAALLPGANPNNVQIEVYRWRKWHGIRGRQAKPDASKEQSNTQE